MCKQPHFIFGRGIIVFRFAGLIRLLYNLLRQKSAEWSCSALSRIVRFLLPSRVRNLFWGMYCRQTCVKEWVVNVTFLVVAFYFLQCMCRLPFTRHSLHVDWLYHMLRGLHWGGQWMRLAGRRWGSRIADTVGSRHCSARFIHHHRHILHYPRRHHGRAKDLATALPHPRQTNANKGEWALSCLPSLHQQASLFSQLNVLLHCFD